MSKIKEINAINDQNGISAEDMTITELYDTVMEEEVVVLKNVFPKNMLEKLKSDVHSWGLKTKQEKPQTYMADNYHGVESGISPRQKTEHNYHSYNFNTIMHLQGALKETLLEVVDPLRIFQNKLTQNSAEYEEDENGFQLHPQIIHYPSGGGMLGQHVHAFEPQKVGLILGLSERNVDFNEGATYFVKHGETASSHDVHDIGDLILFKFDIPHGISSIDEQENMDYTSERGRWTLVLPYYSLNKFYNEETEKVA